MRKLLLAPLSLAMSLALPTVASAENLIDVYRAALQNDPTYLASDARTKATEEGVAQARSALLPQLNGSVGVTKTMFDGPNPQTGLDVKTTDYSSSVGVTLNQSLFDYADWLALSQADKRAEAARIGLQGQLQSLITRVADSYFNVLAAKDGVEFAEAELKSVGQQLEQTQQRFNVGLIAITDVHEAKARFDSAQAQLIAAQNTLDNANESLRLITGSYYATVNTLKAEFPLNGPEPASVDDWVKAAEENNLSLLGKRLETDIARQEVKRQSAGHLPSLDARATWGKGKKGDELMPDNDTGTTTTVGVTLTVPLYSGGRTHAAANAAEYSYVEASQNMEGAHRQAVRDARSSYLGINAAIASVKAFSQAVVSAQSALEATQAGFEVGTRTIVDVLQATSQLYNAKKNLSRARYDYVLNMLRLKAATGALSEADVAQVNNWLN
jgi:outer membrane protein